MEVQLFSPQDQQELDARAHISGTIEETTHNCTHTVWRLQGLIPLTLAQHPEPLEPLFLKGFSSKLFHVSETAINCDGYKSQLAS